jgi:hypothetical protein
MTVQEKFVHIVEVSEAFSCKMLSMRNILYPRNTFRLVFDCDGYALLRCLLEIMRV